MSVMNLFILELHGTFSGRRFFGKADLRNFYQKRFPLLSETAFRRIIYALERDEQIIAVDAGVYQFPGPDTIPHALKKFMPSLSAELRQIGREVKTAFPYVEILIWETCILHEFMLHQPGQSQMILETEQEAAESIFNYLQGRFMGKVFLDPDRLTFERYILPLSESIVVTPLFTQVPSRKIDGITTAKLEKILVDVFVDDAIFYAFHGDELVHIFETAFARYRVSQKAIFRYAGRRKADRKLREFFQQKTYIHLIRPPSS